MSIDHIHDANWWRPSSPLVLAQGCLRLAPNESQRPYFPWQRSGRPVGRARKVKTLWGEFAELVRSVQQDQISPYQPSKAGLDRILEWSSKFGLLGILPSRFHTIVLPPTYQLEQSQGWPLIRQGTHRVLTAGNWITSNQQVECEHNAKFKVDAPVLEHNLPKGIRNHGFEASAWDDFNELPYGQLSDLAVYFSQSFKNSQFPKPLSDEFWASYQEPIGKWMRSAVSFKNMVSLVSQHARRRFSNEAIPVEEEAETNEAIWSLNILGSGVSFRLEFGPSAVQTRVCAGSLLSIMSRMFIEDLEKNRLSYECLRCGALFVSKDRKARYCSVLCRNTASMGRYRAKLQDVEKT